MDVLITAHIIRRKGAVNAGLPERMIYVNNYRTTPNHEKRVYTVKEIAAMLGVSDRHAYNFCSSTNEFEVIRIGKSIRVKKESFDKWFGN